MAKELNCDLKVSEFEYQSRYYLHFLTNTLRKDLTPPYPPSSGLNSKMIALTENNPKRLICHQTMKPIAYLHRHSPFSCASGIWRKN